MTQIIILGCTTIIGRLFLFLPILLKEKNNKNFPRRLPFECGIENVFISRPPFSLQFFILGLIFIIFDMEILITLFLLCNKIDVTLPAYLAFLIIFVLFLYFTLLLEWKTNKLIWFIWEFYLSFARIDFYSLKLS